MPNFVDFTDDPGEVLAAAARLAAQGSSLGAETAGAVGSISGLEGGAPWGADKYGQEFLRSYQQETGDGPLNEAVQEGLSAAGPRLSDLGDAAVSAVTDIQLTDDDIGRDIGSVR